MIKSKDKPKPKTKKSKKGREAKQQQPSPSADMDDATATRFRTLRRLNPAKSDAELMEMLSSTATASPAAPQKRRWFASKA